MNHTSAEEEGRMKSDWRQIAEAMDRAAEKPKTTSPKLSNAVNELNHACPVCGVMCASHHSSTTYVGYLSPHGHDHDDNCRTFYFTCPQGHVFVVRPQNTCPVPFCEWEGEAQCDTCGGNVRVIE